MDFQKLLVKIAKILNKLRIPYIVTGGYAVSVWGRPRSTFDIDVVIELPRNQISALAKALRDISEMSYIDESMMESAVEKKGEFNFIHAESGIKIDFWVLKDDSFNTLRIKRRIPKKILGEKVYFISPEDLILSKLLWYKSEETSRHLEDIESILKISGEKLDMKYLKNWAKKSGVLKILNKLLCN